MCNAVFFFFTTAVVTRSYRSVTLYVLYVASFVRIEVVYGHAVFPHTCYYPVLYWVDDVIVCCVCKTVCSSLCSFPQLPHTPTQASSQYPVRNTINMFFSDGTRRVRKVNIHDMLADGEILMLIVATLSSNLLLYL
jgi:hypothetical protein